MSTSACLESLVAVRRIPFGLEDPVEPLEVAVPLRVVEPVELHELLVALELADDAVVMEADAHARLMCSQRSISSSDTPSCSRNSRVWSSGRSSRSSSARQRTQTVITFVYALLSRPGSSDPGYASWYSSGPITPLISYRSSVVVVRGEARHEPGNFDDHGTAAEPYELDVARDLVVAPGVVGDRKVDVALPAGVIGEPPPGLRVEVEGLGLLPAVAAALPREHGAGVSVTLGGRPSRVEPPESIAEQRPGQDRKSQVEEREDEQLVPEDVPAIGLAVESTSRDADVEIDGVGRHGLQRRGRRGV